MNVELDPTIMWRMGQKALPNVAEKVLKAGTELYLTTDKFSTMVGWSEMTRGVAKSWESYDSQTQYVVNKSGENMYKVAEALCEMAASFADADGEAATAINGEISENDYGDRTIGDGPRDIELPSEKEAEAEQNALESQGETQREETSDRY